ncbi:neurocan core protein-like [Patiria miniata]|uniref:EGF-like domain-containing protein n=1 Tax=Patiria miniata TaxID=46514 RepID=A0A914A9Z2_PATMI|nr:neurocan core protein-like [Patiria miniata]
MRRHALTALVACVFVTLWGVVLTEKVCYFSQEPDASQSGRLRWVMPGNKEDRCACTSTRPGPVNVQPVRWSHQPFYTDTPIFTNDQEDIHDYFDCHDACRPNPCRHGGRCENLGGYFKCHCVDGCGGDRCQVQDACCSNPCQDGGSCVTRGDAFECLCFNGFGGDGCQLAPASDYTEGM